MLNKKQIVTASATLGIALATGFVMQNGDAVASRFGDAPAPQAEPIPEAVTVAQGSIIPTLTVDPASEAPSDTPVEMAALEQDPPTVMTDADPVQATPICETTMQGEPIAAAMVRLELAADCHPNARVTIHHEGMMFTASTDDTGGLSIDVPALNADAIFIAAFDNNEGAMSQIDVPSVEFYDRVVLQWRGQNALQLHALEFGATYGDAGHVWAASARDPGVAATGQGGFITTLGAGTDETALLAEVYSFPSGLMTEVGKVALSVEAEVTAQNCARDIEAQSIQISPEGTPSVVDLVLSVPDCDAVGDFLIVNSMVQDVTLASR